MAVRLEHANLTVRDIEGTIRFQTAFPEFRVRGQGKSQDGASTPAHGMCSLEKRKGSKSQKR